MASDSSASTTPMVLTPESTGTGSPDSASSSTAAKKTRRQTAFYPNTNSSNKTEKPFSRSAAKRESVMTLGSIEHLQHYFTKTGIAAKKHHLTKQHHGLVPALGGMNHIRTNPSLGGLQELNLPPSPAIPQPKATTFPPFIKTYETDPESLLPGVVEDLTAVAYAWSLDGSMPEQRGRQPPDSSLLGANSSPNNHSSGPQVSFDILGVLKATTHAIRSVRNYVLSLPDESAGTIRAQFRPQSLVGPGKHWQSTSSAPSSSSKQPDPLSLIRRSALDVLTVLRELEEKYRLPLSDDAYDAQSDGGHSRSQGGHSRMASPSAMSEDLPDELGGVDLDIPRRMDMREVDPDMSISFIRVQGRDEIVPVWEDEEDAFALNEEEENEKKERWDERLVLGSGWLYRQDVRLEDLTKEQEVVNKYVDVVDLVLFGGRKDGGAERGWERERRKVLEKDGRASSRASKGRRVSAADGERKGLGVFLSAGDGRRISAGMADMMSAVTLTEEPESMEHINEDIEGEESVDDEELPAWAKRSTFEDDELGRAHAILFHFLPSNLVAALEPATSRTAFLASLSSGQLLCVAYNSCVRKSKKPWGFVSKDGIHDILALEQAERDGVNSGKGDAGKKGWTFRRTDNLRLWVGALKLRYMLPIHVPSNNQHQGSGSSTPALSVTPLSSPGPNIQRFPSNELPIVFDARIVARKDAGWEDMLEGVLVRWIRKVVEEKRNER